MKRRIRYLFVLMCLCILGIIGLQGYWLYNSYMFNYYGFRHDISEALDVAVRHSVFDEAGKLNERTIAEALSSLDDTTYQKARLTVRKWYMRNRRPDLPRPSPDSTNAMLESMYRQLAAYWELQGGGRPPQVETLDSVFADELQLHSIAANYVLDTISFSSDGRGHMAWEDIQVRGFPTTTRHVLLNPLTDIWIQAAFKTPFQYILRQMWWLLIASLLLIGFTTFCFIYMLNTILRQKKLSEIKSDFINNMTHELKTPITTVSAAVQAMQHFDALKDRDKTDSYLSMAEKQLQRLSDLVEKVLDTAASEREEMAMHFEKTDIQELLEEIINAHKLKATKPVSFHLFVSLVNPVVKVDKTHLTNALHNLVDNAIKYSGDKVEITIRCQRIGDDLVIRVRDNGIGIPKAYQREIFEKFFRVPTGNLHIVKGFGLGLSYVKMVIEAHGGLIQLQSDEGKGTEFIITLPQ